MKTKSLGFIGGGRITKIFLQAFANKNVEFQSIVVFDTNADVINDLKQQFPQIEIAQTVELAANQPIVFIALHPPMIMETLGKVAAVVTKDTVVISLAAKITIEKIGSKLQIQNIVRMIPNATSYINEGYNPVAFSGGFDLNSKSEVMEIFEIFGNILEVVETKLEAYALLSAMLPTYFWFQWDELCKIGLQLGLNEEESKASVHQTLVAAVDLMFNSRLSPKKVMDLIPVKPIGEHQAQITEIFQTKLMGLFEKIRP